MCLDQQLFCLIHRLPEHDRVEGPRPRPFCGVESGGKHPAGITCGQRVPVARAADLDPSLVQHLQKRRDGPAELIPVPPHDTGDTRLRGEGQVPHEQGSAHPDGDAVRGMAGGVGDGKPFTVPDADQKRGERSRFAGDDLHRATRVRGGISVGEEGEIHRAGGMSHPNRSATVRAGSARASACAPRWWAMYVAGAGPVISGRIAAWKAWSMWQWVKITATGRGDSSSRDPTTRPISSA
ncbi:MAG: hypothetical protein ACP5C4_06005 [Methanomicrobiales archaeon]